MVFSTKGGIYWQQFLFSNRLDYEIRKEWGIYIKKI